MRKWQTIAVTALSTLALSGAGFTAYQMNQPSHYEGAIFTNEKHTTSHSSNNNMASSSSSTSEPSSTTTTSDASDSTVPAQSPSVEQPIIVTGEPTKSLQMGGTVKPDEITGLTFSVYDCGIAESTIGRIEVGCVVCNELIQKTKVIPIEDCEPFAKWMRSIASDKTNLNNSMDSNYNYWVQNVKGQQ